MKAKSKLINRLWGSFRVSTPPLFMTAQTKRDGSMRIGLKTSPGPSNTPSQIEWRARYSACVDEWNIMTDEQKEAYSGAAKAAGITNYNAFISACLLVPMVTEVVQPDPTKLKATVTQLSINRLIKNLGPYADVKGQVKITDGTNFMPTMDAIARPGYMRLVDTGGAVNRAVDAGEIPPGVPGFNTMPLLYVFDVRYNTWVRLGGIYDYNTNTLSIATSRGAGKSTFANDYSTEQIDVDIIAPSAGHRLQIVGIMTASSSSAGLIKMDFNTTVQVVWRHYVTKFATLPAMDLAFVGGINEPLTMHWEVPELGDVIFVVVNYRDIEP